MHSYKGHPLDSGLTEFSMLENRQQFGSGTFVQLLSRGEVFNVKPVLSEQE